MGPTSSGKTELSLRLAKKFNGVIISADSRQIYREMDIATAKTTKSQQQGIPHYLIDIVPPDADFNLADYQREACKILNRITKENRERTNPIIPFIVGGTGLYIKSIVDDYQLPAASPNLILRANLEKQPLADLAKTLINLDPKTKVDLKNKRRIIRAIEILTTQKSSRLKTKTSPLEYDFLQIGISRPRAEINQRINQKVDEMIQSGVIEETQQLLDQGYDFTKPAFSAHGYQYLKAYLEGKLTLAQATELMKQQTRQYAKRQMTWFKADPRLHWIKDYSVAESLIINFLH